MDPSDDNIQMLLAMGFPSESEVRRALKMAKNDMNEAVDILTNGQALSPYEELPSPVTNQQDGGGGTMDTTENPDFPAANLYELEGRVFTDSWSIPYREDESLAKCMYASITLLAEGRAGNDELCSKFLDNVLPESFKKLLNSQAIYRWSSDIQEGVYDMILILMDLVATSVILPAKGEQTYIPTLLLEVLTLAFTPDCEYHQKNRSMRTKLECWEEKMGAERVISFPIKNSQGFKEFYWLSNLVNKFHYQGGLEMITDTICLPKTNITGMASLTEPLAACVEFLVPSLAKPMFEKSMKKILNTIENLGPDDFKDKHIGRACDLLRNVKIICQSLWKKQVEMADGQRLDLVLRMLKCPHFNAKMNALIEITKMIEDAVTDRDKCFVKGAIPLERLTLWMTENELLSVILSGSIDQAQYCEKVKRIVEHVGPHLSREDLEKLWNRTNDQTNHVVDNIHGIFAAAASQFSIEQFSAFKQLITVNWATEKESMKEKLITLLGLIGKDTKCADLAQKVIEVLLELSHREDLSRELADKALDEMYHIMVDSTVMKDSYKRKYLERCIDSIKKGTWIMPALKQLLSLVKHIVKTATNRADKSKILSDIHKTADITKLLMGSLISCHQSAVTASINMGIALYPHLAIDGKYTHLEIIELHLQCLQFVLQEATGVFMSWSRVKEFWDCMVVKPEACDWDRNTCYVWLTERFNELDGDAACNLFTKKLMTDHSFGLSMEGFECWKKYFEYINVHEHRLKGDVVEKLDLIGLEELWGLCLNIRDVDIAGQAIKFLLHNIYINLASKHKRDVASLHRRFINDCHRRLEALLISLRGGGSVVFRSLSQALYTLTAPIIPDLEKLPAPLRPKYAMNIERLLLIVEQYVLTVEEIYHQSRSILPHGSSFYGSPLTVNCECETRKEHFIIQTHRNESLLAFRSLVADRMNVFPEHVLFNQAELKSNKDQRLLGQLGVDDGYKVTFRLNHLASTNTSSALASSAQHSSSASALATVNESPAVASLAVASASASAVLGATSPAKPGNYEIEKNLPGVMIAQESQVFKLLYQLADLGEQRITNRVVALLHIIPTDPAVIDMVDNVNTAGFPGANGDTESLPGSTLSTPSVSPSPSPRKVRNSTGSTYGSQTSMHSRKSSSTSKLVGLFNNKGTGSNRETSPFRVRYNLEVLSSRIMPVDLPTGRPTQFCEDFMSGNGLALILQIFQVDYFPVEVENEVRQACYSLALQLISYLLCGETVRGTQRHQQVTTTLSAIQTMDVAEFTDMISCMMRVAWAASVGKHHLSSSMQPIRDLNAYGRLRQNSADSATSSSSETDVTCLHAGVCLSQTSVDAIDSSIAVKAFEIMIFCLCSRPELIGCFYSLPCVADFLLDVLTGCCREEVRTCAADSLRKLSDDLPVQTGVEHPKYYLLKIILAARLPYWVSNSSTRGARQRLLSQCLQYFDLRCQLVMNLTLAEQQHLSIDICSMIEDELAWLCNFQPSSKRVSDLSTDDILLTGHLRLVQCLLTCEGVDKDRHQSVIHTLLDDFLFPAAKLEKSADSHDSLADFSPKCMVPLSQDAAYDVLLEICNHNCDGLKAVADKLITWHHSSVGTSEWEYMPPVEGRASSGFVGLKNGGATCYMNSVIQQMFMIPGVPESLLSVDEENNTGEVAEVKTVFHEIQNVFGHLLDSQLQYYEPDQLWHVFKLWGQSVNVREQQDAFDFFTALTDQLDETLKKYNREPVFQNRLQGVFSDQKNCEDCPHKYEREEPFFALNLTVSNPSLEQSLDQFVKGELLEGDNAYFCEKCNQKRNAVKRMCIKSLPPVLCIHLKRFNFDWEANKSIKFDDYFKFPLVLDMGPYTADGKSARYELVGMVVHTGQASAGHYYSYIKDRRGNTMSNETHGKWFKFNDTTVELFEMTDEAMATECFGGKYKAKTSDAGFGPKLPEDRVRYWNAYLLFYERIPSRGGSGRRQSTRLKILRKSVDSPAARQDSLSELSDLVSQGEKQGVFTSKIPGRVQRSIRLDNLQFLRNRNVYSEQYFRFLRNLVSIETADDVIMQKIQLETALKFMLNTYLRTKETLRPDQRQWYKWFKQSFEKCPQALAWFLDYITEDPHSYIAPYLLTCGIKEIREFYVDLLRHATEDYVMHLNENGQNVTMLDTLLETLLALLNREVVEHAKNSQEYFEFFYRYSKLSGLTCDHLLSQDVFQLFTNFVVGKVPEEGTLETVPRRFTVIQTREFWPLQCTLAILLLHLDIRAQSDPELLSGHGERKFPFLKKHPDPLLSVTDDIANILKPSYCPFFIREALITLKEMDSSSVLVVVDGLVYAAHALPHFNDSLIQQIRQQCVSTPGNELRGITKLATQLLLLPDNAQHNRFEDLISEPASGILKIIRDSQSSDSQKSYQLIKLLTSASHNSDDVSKYLMRCASKWQWCVDWLKKKMDEQSWMSHTPATNDGTLSRNFQRTTSAQITLDTATAMFTSSQGSSSDMDVDSIHSEELQTVPNIETVTTNLELAPE